MAILVRRCGLSLADAWAATVADFHMLLAYEQGYADDNKPSHLWDQDKVDDLAEHIANLKKAKAKRLAEEARAKAAKEPKP